MLPIRIEMARVVAPMVSQSDAPFRALCMKYGATCVYSEMLFSDRIVADPNYLNAYLSPVDQSFSDINMRPLIVQVCGHDPKILSEAADRIAASGRADAIDLNLGCPQDRARADLFGSYLLDKCHWPMVFECVRAMSAVLNEKYCMPLFCKIRIVEGHNPEELTKQFCLGLYESGCSLITVHGRTRGSAKHRRAGPANVALISEIARYMLDYGVPVVANGNIRCGHEAERCRIMSSPAVGVMSAEGILRNPFIFGLQNKIANNSRLDTVLAAIACVGAGTEHENADDGHQEGCADCNRRSQIEGYPDLLQLFEEYCDLSDAYKEMGGWELVDSLEMERRQESKQLYAARQHLTWMLGKSGHGRTVRFRHLGTSYMKHCTLLNELNQANDMNKLRDIARKCLRNVWG